jgi:hypothetical protein
MHQPPDHEDDKNQPECAADPDGPALTVIAAAIEPKPASKENHEQHDYQNQFHRSVFHQFCRQAMWRLATVHEGQSSRLWERRSSRESKIVNYTSGRKH